MGQEVMVKCSRYENGNVFPGCLRGRLMSWEDNAYLIAVDGVGTSWYSQDQFVPITDLNPLMVMN